MSAVTLARYAELYPVYTHDCPNAAGRASEVLKRKTMNDKIKTPSICKSCLSEDGFELRRRLLGNGSVQIVFQCLTCGRSAANPIARSAVSNPDQLPPWSDGLAEQYDNRRSQERLEDKAAWFREHDAYLQTDKWRQKRAKVIQRCRNVCEGCMDAPVQHVHHLTYSHWQDELLFELVGLCEPCHALAHKSRDQQAGLA